MNGYDISFPHLGIKLPTVLSGFTVFGFRIAFYGVIIGLGMLAGLMISRWQAKRTGQDPDFYSDFALYGIIFAIVGARLYYVIFSFSTYKDDLLKIFNLRAGGMAIYGGIIGGVLTGYIYSRIKKYSFMKMADTAAAGLLIGQLIGRWGNFFNREAFGQYTDSLFAMQLKLSDVNPSSVTELMKNNKVVVDGVTYIQVHPTFLYESVWNLALLVLVILFIKKRHFDGEIFLLYIVGYALGRVWIEGLRTDQLLIPGTNIAVSQVLSAVVIVAGVVFWIWKMRRLKKEI